MKSELTSELAKQAMESSSSIAKIASDDSMAQIVKAADVIIDCLNNGGKVLICGNGGSAAESQHFAGELIGRYKAERKGLGAIALTADSTVVTAWSNDYSFETVFSRQIEALGKKEDVLVALSTSGNSANVIRAVETAKKIGMNTIAFTGKKGKLSGLCDVSINIDSGETPRIQEGHLVAVHLICSIIDNHFSKSLR